MKKEQAITGQLYSHEGEVYFRMNNTPEFIWYRMDSRGNFTTRLPTKKNDIKDYMQLEELSIKLKVGY